ncbi:MAG: hypothetical protein CV090_00765 [Nitrospira sp. WS238]|nr:hypothetical protein [Nitrospira sp. WS238]
MTGGTLTAPGGQINLTSLAGRGEAQISPQGIAITGSTSRGYIEIKGGIPWENRARLDTSDDAGGAVVIRGGKLSLVRTEITTGGASHTGGPIVIEATKSATLDSVDMRTGPFPFSGSSTVGGGAVSLTAPWLRAFDVDIQTQGNRETPVISRGPAGDVAINVRNLTASYLNILSEVLPSSSGPGGGNVSIHATGNSTLQNSSIATPGQISVRAARLTLGEFTGISANTEAGGPPANIVLDVGRLTMTPTAVISVAGRNVRGESGNISVSARDAVLIDGGALISGVTFHEDGGSITVSTPRLTLDHFGSIATASHGARAGDISLNVRTLNLFNGARIRTQSSSGGSGNISIAASQSITMAGFGMDGRHEIPSGIDNLSPDGTRLGSLHIVTPTMRLVDRARIREAGTAPGGMVLDVGRLDLLRGARIISSGYETSPSVVINAAESIALDKGVITTDSIDAHTPGTSGNVSLHAGQSIQILNGSRISADTEIYVEGNLGVRQDAGHIVIQAGNGVVSRDSTISAKAQALTGNGGTIVIDAGQNFVGAAGTFSVAGVSPAGGDSGQIRVTARESVLLDKRTVMDATNSGPGGGHAGHIMFDAGKHVIVDASRVIAPVEEGEAGQIELRAGKDVRLVNGTVVDASASTHTDGGQVLVDAGRNILVDRSQVKVPVGDGGAAHKIEMHAGNGVWLTRGTILDASGKVSDGGQIVIDGRNVLVDGSRLTVDSPGYFGGPGKVTVRADGSVRLLNGTLVTASSPLQSSGGQVSITAGDLVQLRNSTIQTSARLGRGGTIGLTSETVRLKNGRLVSSAKDDVGGTIIIKTNDFRRDAASLLDFRGSLGNGTVTIEPLP